jgi:hypothetical protein
VNSPVVALEHVRVIDGTGARPLEDQTVVMEFERAFVKAGGLLAAGCDPTGKVLGMDDRLGSIAAGKEADLVKVHLLFKDGVGYDPEN